MLIELGLLEGELVELIDESPDLWVLSNHAW